MPLNWYSLRKWKETDEFQIKGGFSLNPTARKLDEAAEGRKAIKIVYKGGRSPGSSRIIIPIEIFKKKGNTLLYLRAFCKKRRGHRIFRIDRIDSISDPSPWEIYGPSVLKLIFLIAAVIIICYFLL